MAGKIGFGVNLYGYGDLGVIVNEATNARIGIIRLHGKVHGSRRFFLVEMIRNGVVSFDTT